MRDPQGGDRRSGTAHRRRLRRARPDAGLEGRAIERLRRLPKPRPHWLRFVTAAAAVVLLGLIGGAVRYLALDGTLPMIRGEERVLMKQGAR